MATASGTKVPKKKQGETINLQEPGKVIRSTTNPDKVILFGAIDQATGRQTQILRAPEASERERLGFDIPKEGFQIVNGKEVVIPGGSADPNAGSGTGVTGTGDDGSGLTPEQAARGLVDAEFSKLSELGAEFGIDSPTSFEASLKRQQEQQKQRLSFEEQQVARQNEIDQQELGAFKRGAEATQAGAGASLAQGREDAFTASKPLAFQTFQENITRKIDTQISRVEGARQARAQSLIGLREAQQSQNEAKIKQFSSALASAESQIRQEEAALLDAQSRAVDTALKLESATEARGVTVAENLSTMGAAAANLSIDQLGSMIANTNLTMPQALSLREAAVLEGQAESTKNELEAEKLRLQADKLRAEVATAGKASSQIEFEFFDTLSTAKQSEFLELKRAQPNLQFSKMEDGSIVSMNPKTGQAQTVFTPSESLGGFDVTPGTESIADAPAGAGSNGILEYQALFKGSSSNAEGVDFAAPIGTSVAANIPGQVISVFNTATPGQLGANGGWGNQVIVQQGNKQYLYSHLDSVNINVGDTVSAGQNIGSVGNTGKVLAGSGAALSQAQIAAGRGAHLDYTVKQDGKKLTLDEAYKLSNATVQAVGGAAEGTLRSTFERQVDGTGITDPAQKKELVDQLLKDSFATPTEAQGKAAKALEIAGAENQLYNSIIQDVDKEDFAKSINIISRKITDTDEQLTGEVINRLIKDPGIRRAINSELRWLGAILREESGAAITVGEYMTKGSGFFPRAGDDELTLQDKAVAREREAKSLRRKLGPSGERIFFESTDGQDFTAEAPETNEVSGYRRVTTDSTAGDDVINKAVTSIFNQFAN